MPYDFRLVSSSTAQQQFSGLIGSIYSDVDTHPGTLVSEISSRIGQNAIVVRAVLDFAIQINLVVSGIGNDDQDHFYTAGDWSDFIRNNYSAARTWIQNNNNKLVSDMATDLSLPHEVAIALASALEFSLFAKRIAL